MQNTSTCLQQAILRGDMLQVYSRILIPEFIIQQHFYVESLY